MLEVEGLAVAYGAIEAVKDVTFTVEEGRIVCLVGTNGAGKTTTLRAVSGLLRPHRGEIRFLGRPIHHLPAHTVLALGIAHCPEGRRLFTGMTVEENLMLGAHLRRDSEIAKDMLRVYELFPVLGERQGQRAGLLSGGEQQMLAIGRAVMARPKLLMFDEPTMGLAPIMIQRILDTIALLRDQGTTVLMVEQNALAALTLADHGHVIDLGRTTLSGPGRELLADPRVRSAYLG
ncbi:Branched-chain amino acid transport ATP-binding protein LivF (TC 3.A.1.4.1) [[Actinomadura] parvosata subsp. kistnae]|uniref:ABC transporter ATP-binding protein n=1 Tax=[Actinomadura] parvosata subsp. kistnae TaxID=1909395 RepID=A0A1V0A889_9ACTN|nr:ABC transporter ATP-binding protein [Nonomuraea sp. ATCC 55076]AQZ66414.1 ABC transporter ATP-binding protein [Nonomuraea sp. ATCC 55076]SPL95533.1 Branched-chain amino acid transport ATP-binding protein LivF (TC 3.A.1.4.1) [Actinomadura parvosata subsp. kistnae]